MSKDRRPGATLTFGGSDGAAGESAGNDPAIGRPPALDRRAQPLPPARRARQRRRAAQRRSRARMREGSEALLAFLILVGLTLLLIDVQTDGRAYDTPREAAALVLGPLQIGADAMVSQEPPDSERLARERLLLAELSAAEADRRRLQELEELFGLVGRSQLQAIGAGVVALDARGGSIAATIDRGSGDGVAADQAVLAGAGVVGTVTSAAPTSAVVRLSTDSRFAAGARLADSGEAAIVRGTGDPDRLAMELLDPLAPVAVGDRVVTIGSPQGRPFPPGLVIGAVVDPGDPGDPRRIVELTPAADLTQLSAVAVVAVPSQEAR